MILCLCRKLGIEGEAPMSYKVETREARFLEFMKACLAEELKAVL